MDLIKFSVKTFCGFERPLEANSYDEAISELYSLGFVNIGEVILLIRHYREISCTPCVVKTDYNYFGDS